MTTTPTTHRSARRSTLRVALATLLLTAVVAPVSSSAATIPTFVPIGASYTEETLQQFAAEAAQVDGSGDVSILVVPITFGVDPLSMSNGLRKQNLTLAETRRGQVEAACLAVVPAGETCHAVLAPVLVRDDAFDPANVALVTPGLDGIYILGGDQVVAMQVVANTPFEAALATAQAAGAVTGGNSAGAAVQSADMIAGYIGSNGPEQGLEQGAVDLWLYDGPTDDTRGLVFGLHDVLFDQHVLQRGRIARLISAAFTAGEIGIGVDADTAVTIEAGTDLTEVGGASAAFVTDSLTYNSLGQFDPSGTLSIHDVATHVLAPGDGYDMAARQPIAGGLPVPAPDLTGRALPTIATPVSAGPILLAGGAPSGSVLDRFLANAGGPGSSIVVLAAGYAKPETATKDAKAFAAELGGRGASANWFVLGTKTNEAQVLAALDAADGVFLTAPDPSTVLAALASRPAVTSAVLGGWVDGGALLANDAAASAVSEAFTTDPRPGTSTGSIEAAAIAEFRPDSTTIAAGLGWVEVAVEPGIVSNRHWGRLYNVVAEAATAERIAIGIDGGTAVEFRPEWSTPRVVGDSAAVLLDGRSGTFGVGANGALSASWVILDTFVGGQAIEP